MAAGKRKRGAGFSERDKFEHKSRTLLQREAKKVKAFLARKAVQQLKQQQQQQQAANSRASGDADAAKAKKQRAQTQKRERELAALKALDVKQVVARAFEVTGLKKHEAVAAQAQAQAGAEDRDVGSDDSDDEMRAMAGEDEGSDSGFDSEEYEKARGIGAKKRNAHASSNEESAGESDGAEGDGESSSGRKLAPEPEQTAAKAADRSAELLTAELVERVLAHKQMAPLLDAIRQWVKKEELEEEKRVRRQEKRALKRGRKEVLVGGRSVAPPSSMFLGSLSGRGGVDDMDGDDDGGAGPRTGHMAGADDDIAEFLGETKKKNRPGQMARRQKAIRQEEARKRKEDRERGVFRPRHRDADADSVMGKYGPSARPKKPKKHQQEGKDKDKSSGGRSTTRKSGVDASRSGSKRSTATAGRTAVKESKPEIAHPSWLAKQAQKEKERVSITAFSGKKITFD